jgi:hypothetical protein
MNLEEFKSAITWEKGAVEWPGATGLWGQLIGTVRFASVLSQVDRELTITLQEVPTVEGVNNFDPNAPTVRRWFWWYEAPGLIDGRYSSENEKPYVESADAEVVAIESAFKRLNEAWNLDGTAASTSSNFGQFSAPNRRPNYAMGESDDKSQYLNPPGEVIPGSVPANDMIPRRNRLDLMTAAELSIRSSMLVVETLGCDERLTEAVCLLDRARELVADVVDDPLRKVGGPAIITGKVEDKDVDTFVDELRKAHTFSWQDGTKFEETTPMLCDFTHPHPAHPCGRRVESDAPPRA